MNTLLKKIRSKGDTEANGFFEEPSGSGIKKDPAASSHDENTLNDDHDLIFGGISGTLAIAEDPALVTSEDISDSSKDVSYHVPCDGNSAASSSVTFDVISAEVIRDGRSGHVNYTILINPHKDSDRCHQSVVVRRYTDFEDLHHRLKKKYSSLLSNISFPRKILIGNLTSQTIAKRSTAFEQYLAHLFSHFDIRYSQEFMEFFVRDRYSDGVVHFLEKRFTNAIDEFEKSLPFLEKLYGNFHHCVCFCICALVSCYVSIDKPALAHACVEVALRCCCSDRSAADEELRVSLMLTAIRLYWTLGKEKQDLEQKISDLKQKGLDVNTVPDLRDVLTSSFRLKHGVTVSMG